MRLLQMLSMSPRETSVSPNGSFLAAVIFQTKNAFIRSVYIVWKRTALNSYSCYRAMWSEPLYSVWSLVFAQEEASLHLWCAKPMSSRNVRFFCEDMSLATAVTLFPKFIKDSLLSSTSTSINSNQHRQVLTIKNTRRLFCKNFFCISSIP